jgi:hypothetical protein
MSNGNRKDAPKLAWFCRTCKVDGKPARNYGHRLSCFRCFIAKGLCHSRDDTPTAPSRSTSGNRGDGSASSKKAAESARKEKGDRDREIAQLKAQVATLIAKSGADPPSPDGTATPVAVPAEADTIDELLAQLAFFSSQGKSEAHPRVVEVTAQLKMQRAAKALAMPAHAQVAKADRHVKACQTAIVSAGEKRAKLVTNLESVQASLAEHDAHDGALRKNLHDAETSRAELLLFLRAGNPDLGTSFGPITGAHAQAMATELEAISGEAWAKLGLRFDISTLALLMRGLSPPAPAPAGPAAPETGGREGGAPGGFNGIDVQVLGDTDDDNDPMGTQGMHPNPDDDSGPAGSGSGGPGPPLSQVAGARPRGGHRLSAADMDEFEEWRSDKRRCLHQGPSSLTASSWPDGPGNHLDPRGNGSGAGAVLF